MLPPLQKFSALRNPVQPVVVDNSCVLLALHSIVYSNSKLLAGDYGQRN